MVGLVVRHFRGEAESAAHDGRFEVLCDQASN